MWVLRSSKGKQIHSVQNVTFNFNSGAAWSCNMRRQHNITEFSYPKVGQPQSQSMANHINTFVNAGSLM